MVSTGLLSLQLLKSFVALAILSHLDRSIHALISHFEQSFLHFFDLLLFLVEFFSFHRRVVDRLGTFSKIKPPCSVICWLSLIDRFQIVDNCLLVFFELVLAEFEFPDGFTLFGDHVSLPLLTVLFNVAGIVDLVLQFRGFLLESLLFLLHLDFESLNLIQ